MELGSLGQEANIRWNLSLRDRDLKQLGRDQVGEFLIERAREAVEKIDLADGERFLAPDFGVSHRLRLGEEQVRHRYRTRRRPHVEPEAFKQLVREKAEATYKEREIEYPGHGRAVPLYHPRPRRA